MTEQESITLNQMRDDYQVMRGDLAQIKRGMRQLKRIQRALLGDIPYGDIGVIEEHKIMLKQLADVQVELKEHRAAISLITMVARQVPVWAIGFTAFVIASGGDVGAILQFLVGMVK